MKALCSALAAVLAIAAGNAWSQQQIYRWVDADGRVRYTSEKPPDGVKASPLQSRISSYAGTPTVVGAPRAATDGRGQPAEVKMYMTDWCGYCKKAREFMTRKGVRHVELDIEKVPAARAEYDRLGARGVPVILVGAQRMNGYSEERLAAMLKANGH
jgi:glutaredoxin